MNILALIIAHHQKKLMMQNGLKNLIDYLTDMKNRQHVYNIKVKYLQISFSFVFLIYFTYQTLLAPKSENPFLKTCQVAQKPVQFPK